MDSIKDIKSSQNSQSNQGDLDNEILQPELY